MNTTRKLNAHMFSAHKKTDFQPCIKHVPELVLQFWNDKERVYNQISEAVLGGGAKVARTMSVGLSKTANC